MKFQLRPYQADAVDSVMSHVKTTVSSCVIVLPTGAGKSVVVAELAGRLYAISKKRVLCIAPSSELVTQNRAKYLLTGEPASMFSASAGQKNLRHPVVFGTPGTVKGSIDMFGEKYGAIIIDECHGITPTIRFIINEMKRRNPRLRVIGMTATPYRMNTGYIYKDHYEDGQTDETNATDPYFDKVVYELPAKFLIENGFLTPPTTDDVAESYQTGCLEVSRMGSFTSASVEKAFTGQGRKTSRIVSDIVSKASSKKGVMIFCASKKHAAEVIESMPEGVWVYVDGDMPKAERDKAISDFRAQKFKYIINVRLLTTGFDAPHVDAIATLCATESPGLYQQIIGRGTRLYEGKDVFHVWDYAGNIERHFSETGDLFTPEIKARPNRPSVPVEIKCPDCGYVNEFGLRPNDDGFELDDEGYFVDLAGDRVEIDVLGKDGAMIKKPLPGHFGRRCKGLVLAGRLREMMRCTHKWSSKECPECGTENDIAARNCSACKAEIIDPNQKLQEEAAKLDAAPDATRQAEVTMMSVNKHYVSAGEDMVVVKFAVPVSPWFVNKFYSPSSEKKWMVREWEEFSIKAYGEVKSLADAVAERDSAIKPSVIMFRKDKGSKYFNVKGMYWGDL